MQTFLKACRWGQFLLIEGDMISDYADRYGEWCESEVRLFEKLLPRNGVVVEVGANLGLHSVPLSRFCEDGRVFCYEPQRIVFQLLCANAALNNRINIHARQCAAGARDEVIAVQTGNYDEPWNYGAFSVTAGFSTESTYPASVRREPVAVVTLDRDPVLQDIDRLDLFKIDAEGHESAVLQGAQALIARFRPLLFIENNREDAFDSLLREVNALDYRCYWFCSSRYRPDNFNKAARAFEGADINMLCVPSSKAPPAELVAVTGFKDLKDNRVPLY